MQVTRKIITRVATIFLKISDRLSGDIPFSSLVSFALFDSCFFVVVCLLLFELKNVHSDTYLSFFWPDYKFLWTSARLPGSSSSACTFQASCCIKTWQEIAS